MVRKRYFYLSAGVFLVLAVGFVFGFMYHRSGFICYRVKEAEFSHAACIPADRPGYGLPLVEYTVALSNLEEGRRKQAVYRLNMFLDMAVLEAFHRYQSLNKSQQLRLARLLRNVAEYRESHPRFLAPPNESGYFWTRSRQVKVDSFLESFLDESRAGQASRTESTAR